MKHSLNYFPFSILFEKKVHTVSTLVSIPLSSLKPGVILPAKIFDGQNPSLLLLGKDVLVSEMNIDRLKQRGVTTVAIDQRYLNDVCSQEFADLANKNKSTPKRQYSDKKKKTYQTREELAKAPLIKQAQDRKSLEPDQYLVQSQRLKRSKKGDTLETFYRQISDPQVCQGKSIQGITVDSIEDMLDDLDVFVKLAIDPGAGENNDYHHCVRVSELSMAIAAVMDYPRQKIEELGMGCLIFRSAMSQKTKELRELTRELSVLEKLEFEKNPMLMFAAMQEVADLPKAASQVAYQIYERWDGTGYPRQRSGNQIHPLARIASVADCYVALTSGRPHRAALEPYIAVKEILEATKDRKFDPKVIKAFLKTICLYPIGSYVELSDGSVASVERSNIESYDNPVVKLLLDSENHSVESKVIDLAEFPHLFVTNTIDRDVVDSLLYAQSMKSQTQKTFQWADESFATAN